MWDFSLPLQSVVHYVHVLNNKIAVFISTLTGEVFVCCPEPPTVLEKDGSQPFPARQNCDGPSVVSTLNTTNFATDHSGGGVERKNKGQECIEQEQLECGGWAG